MQSDGRALPAAIYYVVFLEILTYAFGCSRIILGKQPVSLLEPRAAGAAGGDISSLTSMRAVATDSRRQAVRRMTNDWDRAAWVRVFPRR
jgi:hypothetical protein